MSAMSTSTADAADIAGVVEEPEGGRLRGLLRLQVLQIVLLLVATVAVFGILRPDTFLTLFNFRGIVQSTAILAVLGVGMTFVIITGGIDLSVGSVLVFSGVVADKAMAAQGGQGWGTVLLGTAVACAAGLGWGLLNGFLVAKAKVAPLIVTLGSLSAALQKDPDIVGIFASNLFSAEGAATGIRQAGKQEQVKVVGFDAGPDQVKALQDGTVQALIAQQPGDIGTQGVQQAIKALKGESTTKTIKTGFTIITKDNLNSSEGQAAAYKANC